jgi:hypothetical protein
MVYKTFQEYWAANWPKNGMTVIMNEAFKEVAENAWNAGAAALGASVLDELGLPRDK